MRPYLSQHLYDFIEGNEKKVRLICYLSSAVSKLNLKENQTNSIEYHQRAYLSCIDKPRKTFLSFFNNFSGVILLKVRHSYIRLMMGNRDGDSLEKIGLFCNCFSLCYVARCIEDATATHPLPRIFPSYFIWWHLVKMSLTQVVSRLKLE